MIRLLQIEWLKLRHNRAFWILVAMYSLCLIAVCSSAGLLLDYLEKEGANINGISPSILPIYDFPDIWHNITYVASFLKVLLGFIVIISIANEATYRTLRQNIIDGLSKEEFLKSKILFIAAVSLAAVLLTFVTGLVTGFIYSKVLGPSYIFKNMSFLFAYGLDVFGYMTFSLMVALLIRKGGLVIVGILMYTLVFDPMMSKFFEYFPYWFENARFLKDYLPVTALNNLIHIPFLKYALQEIQDYVSFREVAIVVGWIITNIGLSLLILKKKDL